MTNKIEEMEKKLSIIKKIKEVYSDVKIETDRFNTEYYCSSLAIKDMNSVAIHASCGCCPDPAIIARCYVVVADTKVYESAFGIKIGEGNNYTYDRIDHNWKERLHSAGIRSTAIEDEIKKYFIDEATTHKEDLEEELESITSYTESLEG